MDRDTKGQEVEQAQVLNEYYVRGTLTLNEARAQLGLNPYPTDPDAPSYELVHLVHYGTDYQWVSVFSPNLDYLLCLAGQVHYATLLTTFDLPEGGAYTHEQINPLTKLQRTL